MEAKDTILKSSVDGNGNVHFPTREEQAEISFEAGIIEGEQRFVEKISFNRTMDMMLKKKEGIKEVVDWIEKHKVFIRFSNHADCGCVHCSWQAELQEWGIKEEK